jgi:hypothetical protein
MCLPFADDDPSFFRNLPALSTQVTAQRFTEERDDSVDPLSREGPVFLYNDGSAKFFTIQEGNPWEKWSV